MKKFLLILIALSFCLGGCGNSNQNSTNDIENNVSNYNASRTSILDNTNNENLNSITDNPDNNKSTESEISSFSTKIYTPNDTARQNNIRITCSKLNETIVKSRRNFFFLQYSRKSYS